MSPLAFVWDPNLTLTRVPFDLDPCDPTSNSTLVMNFLLVKYFLVTFGIVTDGQTGSDASEPTMH